jgi:hypothetical protein
MYCSKYKCSLSNPDACLIRQTPSRLWDGLADPACKQCPGFQITLKLGIELKGLMAQVELFQTQLNTTLEAIGIYTLTNPPE